MMKKWSKASRILALLTVMLAVIGFAPARAYAANVAKIGEVEYPSLKDAIEAAEQKTDGATVELLDNVTLADKEYILIKQSGANVVLDLKGFTVSMNDDDTISIQDGDNIKLVVKNGTIVNTHEKSYGLYVYGENAEANRTTSNNVDVTFENVSLKTVDQAIGVNGTNANNNVTLRNCVIESTATLGAYWPPKSGTLTIENTALKGKTALYVKGGDVVVKGDETKLVATGEKKDPEDYYYGNPDSNMVLSGDAIYVESGYNDREINIVITDGSVVSEHAAAMQFYVKPNETSPDRDIKATGGTYSDTSMLQFAGDNVALKGEDGFSVMTADKARESGAVASVTTGDGKTVYFTTQEEAEEFAKGSVGSDQTPPAVNPVTYKVSFDLNGVSGTVETQTVNAGELAQAPSPDPSRDGYIFDGWFAPNADEPFDFESPIMGDVVLTAKWSKAPQAKEFTVTFDDGVHDPTTVKVKDGERVTKPEAPVHKGWKFIGWFTVKAADGTVSGEWKFDEDVVTADMTLYGGWRKIDAAGDSGKPQNKLPQTGDTSAVGMVALGVAGVAAVTAGIVVAKHRKSE